MMIRTKHKRWRVGAVSYLNTKPLIHGLDRLAPEIDLILEVPSRLASELASGRLDIALIPSIEYFRGDGYTILPDISIASRGPVMSVKLCSRVPFASIKTVALDEGSRTSVGLTRVLLKHLFSVEPTTREFRLDQDIHAQEGDAVLVIGDRAMRIAEGEFPFTLDLGYEWSRWTGLPFVFAFWAVRPGVRVPARVRKAFVQAKMQGREHIPQIARVEAARLGLDETQCRYYLERSIRHDLGAAELEGLERFARLAGELELIPQGARCVFHGSADLAASH